MTALPPESRILRHVPGGKHQDGKVDGSVFVPLVDGEVFQLREKLSDGLPETGLSVASLDVLKGDDQAKLNELRETFPKQLKAAQRFAELTVTGAIQAIREQLSDHEGIDLLTRLSLEHTPIEAGPESKAFAAHCDVLGLPLRTDAFSALVGEAISYAVTALHPAVVPPIAPSPQP